MKHYVLTDRMFQQTIYLTVEPDRSKFLSFLDKKYGVVLGENVDATSGFCVQLQNEKGCTFWIWQEKEDTETTAHEFVHLMFRVLDKVGMKYSAESEEVYAWFYSSMVEALMKRKRVKL